MTKLFIIVLFLFFLGFSLTTNNYNYRCCIYEYKDAKINYRNCKMTLKNHDYCYNYNNTKNIRGIDLNYDKKIIDNCSCPKTLICQSNNYEISDFVLIYDYIVASKNLCNYKKDYPIIYNI
jgi:hypothetical protein